MPSLVKIDPMVAEKKAFEMGQPDTHTHTNMHVQYFETSPPDFFRFILLHDVSSHVPSLVQIGPPVAEKKVLEMGQTDA